MENQPTPIISDEYMLQMRARARNYSLFILKFGEARNQDGAEKIIWEHGRRNHALRAQRLLSIVCPVSDSSEVAGIGIFNASVEEVKTIMDEDPGVKAGIFCDLTQYFAALSPIILPRKTPFKREVGNEKEEILRSLPPYRCREFKKEV